MTLREFENGQCKRLGQFMSWWNANHKRDPRLFPMEMEPGGWDEQFAQFDPETRFELPR